MIWPSEKGPHLKIWTRLYVPFTYISYLVYIFNDKKDDDQCLPGPTITAALHPSRVTSPLNVLTSGVFDSCCWHDDVRQGGTFWSLDTYVTVNMSWHTRASTLLTCKSNVNYNVFRGHNLQRIENCNRNFNIYCHNSVHYISNYTSDFKYFAFKCVMIVLYVTLYIRKFTYF